jgi:mRNA-degrading endonuclease toxin of MazEF toxin-antitoxin module
VPLPPGGKISGVILADHVKNVDRVARRAVFEAKAPADVVIDVRERLRVLLGL